MDDTPTVDTAIGSESLKIAVSHRFEPDLAAGEIADQLGDGDFAFILVFFSPDHDASMLANHLKRKNPAVPLFGCSTAGEMTLDGLVDGAVVALAFSARDFGVRNCFFPNLKEFSMRSGQTAVRQEALKFHAERDPEKQHCFALLIVDGLSYLEEQLVWAIYYGLEDIPLIGGSAGDGLNFKETSIIYDGMAKPDAAHLLLIESRCPLHIFSSDSLLPTPYKFVVTKADPENRIVYELNAMPAAEAYGSAIGVISSELDLLSFATHPLTVMVGDDCYVRSIKDVNPDGSFGFYCAIDEGIVFTLSDVGDMVSGIEQTFQNIQDDIGPPQVILGFDCVLRRLICEANQSTGQINQLYRDNRVIGFNTYGEQIHAMHLNQTFSGIAIGR